MLWQHDGITGFLPSTESSLQIIHVNISHSFFVGVCFNIVFLISSSILCTSTVAENFARGGGVAEETSESLISGGGGIKYFPLLFFLVLDKVNTSSELDSEIKSIVLGPPPFLALSSFSYSTFKIALIFLLVCQNFEPATMKAFHAQLSWKAPINVQPPPPLGETQCCACKMI